MRRASAACLATALNGLLLGALLWTQGSVQTLQAKLFLFLLMSFTLAEGLSQRPGPQVEASQTLASLTGGTLLLLFVSGALNAGGSPRGSLLGSALMSAGIGLRVAAIRALGARFTNSVLVEIEAPIRSGVYRYMRHPSELGLLGIGLGASVLLSSWVAFVVWALGLLPLVLIRVHREDAELMDMFGASYQDYTRHVPGLRPRWPVRPRF